MIRDWIAVVHRTSGTRRLPVRRHFTAAGAALTLTVAGVFAGPAAVAHAVPGVDLTCTMGATATFSPGINLAPQDMTGTVNNGTISNCVDTSGQSPTVGGGTFDATFTGQDISCVQGAVDGTATITWTLLNGGTDTSSLSFHVEFSFVPPKGSATGVITAGRFAGDSALAAPLTITVNPADCLTAQGITSAAATAVFTLAHL